MTLFQGSRGVTVLLGSFEYFDHADHDSDPRSIQANSALRQVITIPAIPAVKELALEKFPNIPLYQPDKASTPAFQEELRLFGADLFVVFAVESGDLKARHIRQFIGCLNECLDRSGVRFRTVAANQRVSAHDVVEIAIASDAVQ